MDISDKLESVLDGSQDMHDEFAPGYNPDAKDAARKSDYDAIMHEARESFSQLGLKIDNAIETYGPDSEDVRSHLPNLDSSLDLLYNLTPREVSRTPGGGVEESFDKNEADSWIDSLRNDDKTKGDRRTFNALKALIIPIDDRVKEIRNEYPDEDKPKLRQVLSQDMQLPQASVDFYVNLVTRIKDWDKSVAINK